MSDKLDIIGTWEQKKNFWGITLVFLKIIYFCLYRPLLPRRFSSPLRLLKKDWRNAVLDPIKKGTDVFVFVNMGIKNPKNDTKIKLAKAQGIRLDKLVDSR